MKLPHLRSEQIKTQPDQTSALINKIIDRVNDPNLGGGGGGGGTTDFNQLTNRPSYAGTTMTGNTNIPAVPTKTSQLNNDSGFVNTTDLTNAISNHNTSGTAHSDIRNSITNLSNSVTAIQNVIPTAATANNKLTDKNYVDDSINSVTAYYITKNAQGDPFATKAELSSATTFYSGGQVRIPTRNDYCIVVADESQRDPITGEDPTTRYIYNNGWEFQYIVNKTALTADQLAALNSGVTAADVTKLSGIESGAEVNVQADWTEADNTSDAYIKNKPTIGNATLTVTQNGTSVGTFTANATSDVTLALTDTLYNDFTGATSGTAGAHGLVIAPAAGDQMKALYGDGTWKLAHMTIAAYGKSTYAEILAAYQANNIIYCRASSNSNPGTGNQLRMAFLAYVNNETTPTEFEFQYYRSVATHTDSQQGDQVYVYKINSSGTWSVTVREAYTKVKAGTNMTSSYSSGTITLNATDTTYSDFTGATPSIAGTSGLVPAPTTSDPDKFLKGDGTWDTPTDTTYSDFTGATSGTAGAHGLVPAPAAGDEDKVLKGDGTWGVAVPQPTIFYCNPADIETAKTTATTLFYNDYDWGGNFSNPATAAQLLNAFATNKVLVMAIDYACCSEIFVIDGEDDNVSNDPVASPDEPAFRLSSSFHSFRAEFGSPGSSQATVNGYVNRNSFSGATQYNPGTAGPVPAPSVSDRTKFLKGDGTWATVSGSSSVVDFYTDSYVDQWVGTDINLFKDINLTTAATIKDIYDAAISGGARLNYIYGIFQKYSWMSVGTYWDANDALYSISFAEDGSTDAAFRYVSGPANQTYIDIATVYYQPLQQQLTAGSNIQINGTTISATDTTYSDMVGATSSIAGAAGLAPQPVAGDQDKVLKGDGTWDTVDPESLTNGDMYDKFTALDGTEITSNTDLNTIALCNAGMYYCRTNATVATLLNCPTTSAFTMRVYMPHTNTPKDPTVDSWVYTVREIMDIMGRKWVQRTAQTSGTPNTMNFFDWEPITTGEKVDIASTNIDNYSGTLADLVKGIYPEGYHRWYTTTNGATANITDRPAVNGQTGFVMEAFKCRDYTTSDYCYRVVVYSARSNTTDLTDFTYTGYVMTSTTSISWLGYAYNTEPNVSPATDTPNDWKARWRYPGRATMTTFYNTAGKFTNQSQQYGWLQTMEDGGNNYTQLWWPFKDKGRVGYRHGNANGWFDSGHTGRFVYLANKDDLDTSEDVLSTAITAATGYTITGSIRKVGCMVFMNLVIKKNSGTFGTSQEGVATIANAYKPITSVNTYAVFSSSEWASNKSIGYGYLASTIYIKDTNASGSNWAKLNVAYTVA